MSRSIRIACAGMLLLIVSSIVFPVYAMSGACVGMSCHKKKADRVSEPMSHNCCGTSVCADAPEATTETAPTVAPAPQVAVLAPVQASASTAAQARRVPPVTHSPPLDTGERLALLSTLLI